MSRQRIALGDPPTNPINAGDGPLFSLDGVELVRCGSKEYSEPWNFGNTGNGRFDLVGTPPAGTCYFASDLTGAMREVIGPEFGEGKYLFSGYFGNFVYWIVVKASQNSEEPIADLQDDHWNAKGLTSEIFTITDYAVCQQWARQFWSGGHAGLKVQLRHLLSPKRFGIALFGDSGVEPDESRFSCKSRSEISDTERGAILNELGFKVLTKLPRYDEHRFLA